MLTEEQKKTATYFNHSSTIAIPGSGKTHTLISLAANLLEAGRNLVVVTFTREAASEIQARLSKTKGYKPTMVVVGTLHSIAYRQLTLSKSNATLIPPEQETIFQLRALAKASLGEKQLSDFQRYSDARTAGISQPSNPDFSKAFSHFRQLVKRHGGYTLNDIIPIATSLMKNSQSNYFEADHLLIDEVQDCDPSQIAWALAFSQTKNKPKLHLVGDDDQSIYAFRNSSGYEVFNEIDRVLGLRRFILSTNFRSHAEIVGVASNLIGYNEKRIVKFFNSNLGDGGDVSFYSYDDKSQEMDALVSLAAEVPKPLAILTRNNSQLLELSKWLTSHDINHSIKRQNSLFESYEAQLLVSLLNLFIKSDLPTLTNLLFSAGIPEDEIDQSVSYQSGKIHPRLSSLSNTSLPVVRGLIRLILKYRDPSHHKAPDACINGAYTWICNNVYENDVLTRFYNVVRSLSGDLNKRLNHIHRKASESDHNVQLLTMHSSKGKQFQSVIIPFAVQGNIPSEREAVLTDIEEERRLMFVAITRAIKKLVITYHKTSRGSPIKASQFIAEMQQEYSC